MRDLCCCSDKQNEKMQEGAVQKQAGKSSILQKGDEATFRETQVLRVEDGPTAYHHTDPDDDHNRAPGMQRRQQRG